MDFQSIVDSIPTAACVVSVEKFDGDNYGNIRIVTGNSLYIDSIEKPMGDVVMLTRKFTPNSEYTNYLNRDMNFEDACFNAAVKKKVYPLLRPPCTLRCMVQYDIPAACAGRWKYLLLHLHNGDQFQARR